MGIAQGLKFKIIATIFIIETKNTNKGELE